MNGWKRKTLPLFSFPLRFITDIEIWPIIIVGKEIYWTFANINPLLHGASFWYDYTLILEIHCYLNFLCWLYRLLEAVTKLQNPGRRETTLLHDWCSVPSQVMKSYQWDCQYFELSSKSIMPCRHFWAWVRVWWQGRYKQGLDNSNVRS